MQPTSVALDARGREALGDIHRLGFEHVRGVQSCRLYFLHGDLDAGTVGEIARTLLADPVTDHCAWFKEVGPTEPRDARGAEGVRIEVHYRPGVMDPVALSARQAITERLALLRRSASACVEAVRTAWRYTIDGARDAAELEAIARGVLANDCIETVCIRGFDRNDRRPAAATELPPQRFERRTVPVRGLDGPGLERLSREAHLFLSRREMEAIRGYFRGVDREPTDLELETLAQTWSEHCVHKTLKSAVVYRGEDFGRPGPVEVRFDNLLKDTIVGATRQLDRDWCWSVFEDNAGVIAFDDRYGIAFKVETHNHPSAIEPYGGAATGIGGCIRDIMGCGLGAKPIACTDVFCVAGPDWAGDRLPRGVLHPARVLKGVVAGVRDYGNRMGIPTVNGAVVFDGRYLANPLVFCGCVGLIPRDRIRKEARPGDRIVLLGGRTGRDGIHGATFSSAELTEDHAGEFAHAVQIGNPIEQKKVLDALLQGRDHPSGCLYRAVTDCGAGGLSSAVGEMGARTGAVVDLERVPLKYAGLRYDEIWISEAQERMVVAVAPEKLEALLAICESEAVEASVVGEFTDDSRLTVRYHGAVVGELEMQFLHHGLPQSAREAVWERPDPSPKRERGFLPSPKREPGFLPSPKRERGSTAKNGTHALSLAGASGSDSLAGAAGSDSLAGAAGSDSLAGASGSDQDTLSRTLLETLADYNVASREWVIRQYDHEVQGGSVVKPLCGPGEGPGDAAVIRPLLDGWRGVAIGCGLCPQLSDADPYWMAVAAVDEALRNVICVGADPHRTAILDNFCWGGCDTPQAIGALVRACKGAHDAAVAYGLPYVSGKDSLNNQFTQDPLEARRLGLPERMAVPGTLLISSIGIVEDVRRCVTMDLKRAGHPLALVACPADEFGLERAYQTHRLVSEHVRRGDVLAVHDISDGGLAVALAEMCIAGGMGARVVIDEAPGEDLAAKLFDEYATGYVLECVSDDTIRQLGGVKLGEVTEAPRLVITAGAPSLPGMGDPGAPPPLGVGDGSRVVINLDVVTLAEQWRGPLGNRMSGDGLP